MNICQVHETFFVLPTLFRVLYKLFFFSISNIKTSLTLRPVHRECTKNAKTSRNQTTMINQHRQVQQDPQTSLFSNFFIKTGPTELFTLLKIILLQCFQFSVFNFQLYPNGLFIAFPCYARVSDQLIIILSIKLLNITLQQYSASIQLCCHYC